MKPKIGLIGIGLMGQVLGGRLLEAGYAVTAFDIMPDKVAQWAAQGGTPAGSVADVARAAEIIIVAALTMAQVNEIVMGANGIASGIASRQGDRAFPQRDDQRRSARTVLCCSTCEPEGIEELARSAAESGIILLDSPVSGTSKQVREGQGLGLIGGDPEAIAAVDAVIRVIYPRYCVTGPAGSGTRTKLAINLILGLNRLALAEGLAFAEAIGLDLAGFLETARQSAAYAQIMDAKGDMMVAGDYKPLSRVSQHLKDVRTMIETSARVGQELPLAQVLKQMLEACEAHGEGERDNAILIEEIRRRRLPPTRAS